MADLKDMRHDNAVAWKKLLREMTENAQSLDDIKSILLHIINTTRYVS